MPAKGSKLIYGNRNYIYDQKFYEQNLVEKQGVTLDYKTCREIIETCNKNIAEIIPREIDGFKLPFGFGYIVPVKFKSHKLSINWKESNKHNKHIHFANLHTFGYSCKINWYRVGRITNYHFHETFKFKPYRTLSRLTSLLFSAGEKFVEWTARDFVEKSKVENTYTKKYRKFLRT